MGRRTSEGGGGHTGCYSVYLNILAGLILLYNNRAKDSLRCKSAGLDLPTFAKMAVDEGLKLGCIGRLHIGLIPVDGGGCS
jgi:hypothetical protein